MNSKWHGGKGSKRRPEENKKYEESWDKIWGNKKKKEPQISELRKSK
jgi:hypothetical protein